MTDAYTRLTDASELEAAFRAARERPVMLFKHSLTCPVSTAGLREFERWLAERGADSSVEPYLIEIQNHRDLSNAVAERTGVRHESPQALLLKGDGVAWHGSHWTITAKALAEAVDAAGRRLPGARPVRA